jgi:nucleoporin SEH1
MIAVGSDDANATGAKINVFEYVEGQRKWIRIDSVVSSTDPVYDLSFAPNLGRSYHLLAVASKYVQILQLKPISG